MSDEMGNREIIEKLTVIYDDMSKILEKLSNSLDNINDDILKYYEELEKERTKAIELMGLYEHTDDLSDISNMRTIRKGIINIINAAKASMLVDNSYDGQRGINKISLGTLIPLVRFRIHHIPKLKNEIFTIQCFNIMQDLYDEQTKVIDNQLVKSKKAMETLKEDLDSIDVLLNDYEIIDKVYDNIRMSGILGDNYRRFSIQIDDKKVFVEIENMDESKNNFIAQVDTRDDIEKAKFKLESEYVSDVVIDDDSVIELRELQDINISIKDNLNELDRTMKMLEDKKNLLCEDKENLDTVRDDFMKNGTEEEVNEGVGLRLAEE